MLYTFLLFILSVIPALVNTIIYKQRSSNNNNFTHYLWFFNINIALNFIMYFFSYKNYILRTTPLHYLSFLGLLFISDHLFTLVTLKINKQNSKTTNEILDEISFGILSLLLFFFLDITIREECYQINSFYKVVSIFPTAFTLLHILIYFFILTLLSPFKRRIFNICVDISLISIFIIQYLVINIKSQAFTVYDLVNTKEALKYFNTIIKVENLRIILLLLIITVIIFLKNHFLAKSINKKNSLYSKILLLILLVIIRIYTSFTIENYDTNNNWEDITYPKYFYDHYIDSTKSLLVSGLYEYTIRDIFESIKNINNHDDVLIIDEQLKEREYHNEGNDYTGIFKDKNLIMIMMESIDNLIVDPITMPTLYSLRNTGWDFSKRYSALKNGGSTILTEFTSLTGVLYNKNYTNRIYKNTYTESIPNMFKNNGYKTTYIHENKGSYYNRNTLMKQIGFDNSIFLYDYLKHFFIYDDAQIINNNSVYKNVVDDNEKFMTLITTIAAHGPYNNNPVCSKYISQFECLKLAANKTDQMLEALIERLTNDNLIDDTVIILYTDHYAYMYNYTKEDNRKIDNIDGKYIIKSIPLIIYSNDIDYQLFEDTIVNDIDLLPTILNLFGIPYNPNDYVGTDIFADYHNNVALFNDYTWYDGKVYSENYDNKKNDYYKETSKQVRNIIDLNNMILSTDYYYHK